MSSLASTRSSPALLLPRVLGAVALIGVAYVHLDEYNAGYQNIRVIGPLFLLNTISAGLVALALVTPVNRLRRLDPLLALSGIAVSTGALVALFVSEQTPLFGFRETGYRGRHRRGDRDGGSRGGAADNVPRGAPSPGRGSLRWGWTRARARAAVARGVTPLHHVRR